MNSSIKILFQFIKISSYYIFITIVNILVGVIGSIAFEWRTGLTSIGLIPLIILAHVIQLSFVTGLSDLSAKVHEESSQLVSESVMNIRTVLSLGGSRIL